MKTGHKIAKECMIDNKFVYSLIEQESIKGIEINGIIYYDKYQEELIHEILFFGRKIDYVTYESKINE